MVNNVQEFPRTMAGLLVMNAKVFDVLSEGSTILCMHEETS